MSSSRKSRLSAFQVFSAVTKVMPHGDKHKQSEDLKSKKKVTPKLTYDSHRKSNSTPKSLITMEIELDSKRIESLSANKRKSSSSKHLVKERKSSSDSSPVKSLLDISFDPSSQQRDFQVKSGQNERRNSSRRPMPRRPSDVEHHLQIRDVDSERLVSQPVVPTSSKMKPLVVELQRANTIIKTPKSSPKSLLDLSPLGSPKSKPQSLLDLPHARQAKAISESTRHIQRNRKVDPSHRPRLNDSRLKRAADETSRPIEFKANFDSEIGGPPSRKRGKVESNLNNGGIHAYEGKDCHFLIIPGSRSWLHLFGKTRLCVLKGTVSIMAFTLQPKVTYDVFSPAVGCLLAMHVDDSMKIPAQVVRNEISEQCGVKLKDLADDTVAIIKVQHLDSRVCDYLTSFIPFKQLFKMAQPKDLDKPDISGVSLSDIGVKVAPHSEMAHACMKWSTEYNDALQSWSMKISSRNAEGRGPILLTCGGKNTGKSIVNRCAINVTLQSAETVAYLDCDVGQTEFSPPATLSLHIIKKPVLEPPFCHQRHAEKMVFFGDISPAHNPGLYIRCLQSIFEAYSAMASDTYLPLVVNTMGFPEGIGLMIFVDTMNIVQPDLVIQLESSLQYSNFPAITQDLTALEEGWIFNKCPPEDPGEKVAKTKDHELILLPSLASPKRDFNMKLQPMDLRNLALLSSLLMGLESNETLTSMTPFAVPYKHLAVHICQHRLSSRELLVALDASVVALCESDLSQAIKEEDDLPWLFQETPVCQCLGLGFVRAVDKTKGVFLIVTTLPRALLKKVNAVLKGSLTLPDHFYLNQELRREMRTTFLFFTGHTDLPTQTYHSQ